MKLGSKVKYSFRHLADINRDDDDGFGDDTHERLG